MHKSGDENPISEAIDYLGGDSAVQQKAGLKTSWAVAKWRRKLPAERVLWLAEQTGWKYPPHVLAPSLYPNPTDGIPAGIAIVATVKEMRP